MGVHFKPPTMKYLIFFLGFLFAASVAFSQSNTKDTKDTHGPTDTLLLPEFQGLMGNPTILTYGYSNGNGYFFGTNFLDLDQDPNTPYEPGAQACAQGFPMDTGKSYFILDVLVRVGITIKGSGSSGTPLIVSIQYLNDSTTYNINSSSGTTTYTIHSPGTSLGSASILWNDMITGVGVNYSIAHFNTPVFVEHDFALVIDFVDFYLNGDKVGLWCSPPNGGSNIYGLENTLWLYPNPMLWLQVNHLFSNVNRAIALFPVVDDGTFGIAEDEFISGLKLGQSYPNPVAGQAYIEYENKEASEVKIEVVDATGKTVFIKDLGKQIPGSHKLIVDASKWSSGIYYYTIYSGKNHLTKKMVVK